MKTTTRLNEVDRKYIATALQHFKNCRSTTPIERVLIDVITKKINGGIRYDKQRVKTPGNRESERV